MHRWHAHNKTILLTMYQMMGTMQDFGCSRDDFNCQCPQVVNASSNAPAVPAADLACIAGPAAAPAPLTAAPVAAPSLAAAAAPVPAAASPEAAAAPAPVPATGESPLRLTHRAVTTRRLPLWVPSYGNQSRCLLQRVCGSSLGTGDEG